VARNGELLANGEANGAELASQSLDGGSLHGWRHGMEAVVRAQGH
jgi:hypothetical protein